jgi:hypothetical protein
MTGAIIFDRSGTLPDSGPFRVEIEKRQFLLNQISIPGEEHHRYMPDTVRKEIEYFREGHRPAKFFAVPLMFLLPRWQKSSSR